MTLHWHKIVLLTALLVTSTVAQQRPESGEGIRGNVPFAYEAIPLYNVDSSSAVVDFHYRINQRFFIFVRNTGGTDAYVARGELMVELRNDQDIAVARDIRQINVQRILQPLEKEVLPDIEGGFSFPVPDGEYTIITSINDKESGRSFLDRNKKVTARSPRLVPLEISFPMFAEPITVGSTTSTTTVTLLNHGGEVTFGSRGGLLYQLYVPGESPLQVHWKTQRQRGSMFDWFPSFSGDQYTLMNGMLVQADAQNAAHYATRPASQSAWKILHIPLPLEKLDPGGYAIQIEFSSGTSKITKELNFQVLWLTRPLALMNSQLAIDALRHIATEEELQVMLSGSLERNIKGFYDFWRKRDPDTTTAYNEMLVEYYHRVDEANQRFSSTNEQDGYKTDRGRIFILNGSPSQVNKLVPPGEAPMEIWFYDRLKKKFIFSDRTKAGNYILVATEAL